MSRQSINAGKAVIVVELTEKATLQFDRLIATLSSRMLAASRSLRNTALNATGGFMLTGLAVRSTIKDFMEFEAKMLDLAAKMGYMGAVTAEETVVMKDMSETILAIGRSSAYTSQEVADAAISLAQAGFSADELKGSLQGVIDLARGTNYALGESADFVANLVRTFDMFKNDDSLEQRTAKITSLTSQLVKATRLGTIEIVDLREAYKYAGGAAKNLGIDVETLMGFFIQMSEAGLKASLAGTSMNTMMLNLIRNVDLVKKKFPSFNIVMKDAGSIDLIATNRQLLALTANMDVASRTSFFQDIFNIRGARAFTAAMEIDRVEDFTNTVKNAGAESRLAAMKMESGAKGGMQRFTSAIESLNIAMGKLYSKEITALLNSLAFLTTKFEEVTIKHKYLVATFLLSPGILAAIVAGSFTLSFALARLAVALKGVAVAGRGLRFLGGTMVSAALNARTPIQIPKSASALRIAAEEKAYEQQKQKVLALQTRIDNAFAKASALQSATAQQRAQARIASSVTMKNLISETLKGQEMHAKISRRRNALSSAPALGNAIRDRVQTVQETKFYKERQKRYSLYAARMNKQQQYYTSLASIAQNRGFTTQARQYQQSANKARRLRLAAQARSVRAGGLAKASSFQGMMQGLGVIVRTAAVGGKGLASLAATLGRLSVAATRFVFSWNFVGMALNFLLLFGDKIPVVVQAFESLGKGITGAFGQMGKIFTYAAPAMQLLQLAFNAFLEGDTGTGITALQVGFQGLVAIIGNQMTAAWNTFLEHVEYLWIFIMKIYTGLKMIFMSIFEGVKQTFGVVTSPLFSSLADIFGAMNGGGGGLEMFAKMFITGVDSFITWLFKGAIFLHEQLMKFLASFQDVIGQIIGQLPGMGERGKAIQRDAATTDSIASMRGSMARAQLEIERKKRAKEFESMMDVDPRMVAINRRRAAEDSNQASKSVMDWMSGQVELGQNQYLNRINARNAEMARLQQGTTQPQGETVAQVQQRIFQQTNQALAEVSARLDQANLQNRTATPAEMKALYDSLPDMSTDAGLQAHRTMVAGQTGPGIIDGRERAALEQQKFALQQQLAAMMDKGQGANVAAEMPKYLQALTGSAMSTRAIYRVDTKKQEDLLQQQVTNQEETNRLLRLNGGLQ